MRTKDVLQGAAVIDVHAHVVLRETLGAAGEFGPEIGATPDGQPWYRIGGYYLRGVRYEGSAFMDTALRIRAMDRCGIDFQLLSPNPLTYFHFIDPQRAIDFCRRHNDALAELVSAQPQRIGGLAALPMQEPTAAVEELERGVRELGLLGAGIGTDMPLNLDSEALDPFYEALCRLDVPLFIHPGPAGIDGPRADPRLERFELDIMVGFSVQETLAAISLIVGGVLERHPRLDVCISHGGGNIAFVAGRMAKAARKRAWGPDFLRAEGAFEQQLRRLWFDSHVHDRRSLALLAEVAGTERLVLGTNFAGWDQPAEGELETLAGVDMTANARRLLRA